MNKQCKNCHKKFKIYPEDINFYNRIEVPAPTHCPDCRKQRRFAFRNHHHFYSRSCDLCNKQTISVYSPDKPHKVYCLKCWWSDAWEPKDFGRDFDFSRPFFEQYRELQVDTPTLALINDNGVQSENCEYTCDFAFGKNAYMIITSWYAEDSMYGVETNHVKEMVDGFFLYKSELLYDCAAVEDSYNCQYSYYSKNIRDCYFSYDLRSCHDCLFCFGLRYKKYYIWNKEYSKKDYFKEKEKYIFSSWKNIQKYKKEFENYILKKPRRFANLFKCENTTGDNLNKCYNSKHSYIFTGLVNCSYADFGDKAKDCYDIDNTGNPELCYECVTPDDAYNVMFSSFCWKSKFLSYCDNCHSSSDLFGCVGMKKAKYCIFNKQYSKEEYKKIKIKIINHMQRTGEWGEFFPLHTSPFAYNESLAQDYFPLTKEAIKQKGLIWSETLPQTQGHETINFTQVPDDIKDIEENIIKEVLKCGQCNKNYKIIKQEYNFYKKQNIPIPHYCFYCRQKKLRAKVDRSHLWQRQCMKPDCNNTFETTYSPDRKELVYCEECYKKEIY